MSPATELLMQNVAILSAILGVIVLIVKVIYPFIKFIKNFFNWIERFRRDWEGEESVLGRDRTAGVMERLNRLDGELSRNSGKSLKDVVVRLETKLDKIIKNIDDIEVRQCEIKNKLDQ